MKKNEMLNYLKSLEIYKKETLFYEEKMINSNKTIPIKDLVERFIEIDKEHNNQSWNILQILTNINMIIPIEDRKKE
jgi:hypothetical protein